MSYIARVRPKGKDGRRLPHELVTSSCSTQRECMEVVLEALEQMGVPPESVSPDDVQIEFCEFPFVLSVNRDWSGRMVRVYGVGLEEYRRMLAEGGLSAFSRYYTTMLDPKVPVETKIALYERYFLPKKKSGKTTAGREGANSRSQKGNQGSACEAGVS